MADVGGRLGIRYYFECSPNLVVAQQLEQAGKNLVGERKGGQFGLLVSSVVDDVQLLRCRFFE